MSGLIIAYCSDIYSLGVLRVTDWPHAVRSGGIIESGATKSAASFAKEPQTSMFLKTMADDKPCNRRRTPSVGSRQADEPARGDLDWIVMKSLEKDRTRRYDTAKLSPSGISKTNQSSLISRAPPICSRSMLRNKTAYVTTAMAAIAILAALIIGMRFHAPDPAGLATNTTASSRGRFASFPELF